MKLLRIQPLIAIAALLAVAATPPCLAATAEQLIRHNCMGCHVDPDNPDGPLTRIADQRKTPEGWEMTLVRMRMVHNAPFADPDGGSEEEVLRRLIRYFADNQGISPSESERRCCRFRL